MKFQKNGQTIFLENGEEGLLSQSVMSYAWQSVTIKVIWVKHDYESKEVDERMFVAESAELMKEWNTMRNSALGLDPARLKIRSNKKVWWICSNGHEWEATVDNRTMGRGCPYCSRRKVLKGHNDLRTTHPDLAEEWDFEENAPLRPDEVTSISIKRVSWICAKCGHRWKTRIRYRTLNGTGCSECASETRKKKRLKTFIDKRGSLAESGSRLLDDWDYDKNDFSPSDVTVHSNRVAWWKCHVCGYGWSAKISNRANCRGCPCCSHKKLVVGKNDLATTHPELAAEWHPEKNGKLTPRDVMFGQARKVWWLCPTGHSYQATLNHRSGAKGTACPFCNSGRQTSFREQAFYYYLKQIFSDAINRFKAEWLGRYELDIFIPSKKLAIEYDGVAWHKEESFSRECKKYRLCKEHGIKLLRIKERMPAAEQCHYLADEIYSIKNVEGKDNFARLVRYVIDHLDPRSNHWTRRRFSDFHSPIDIDLTRDRFKILRFGSVVRNSVAELHPEIAQQWHPEKNGELKPSMFKCGSDFKAWWICPKCGREYEATISHRVGGTDCTCCSVRRSVQSRRKNKLMKSGGITDIKLIAEWNFAKNNGARPEDFSPGSKEKVWWKCGKCGYEWRAVICNRSNGRGCPCCSNKVVVRGKNDLATLFPRLAEEWDKDKNGALKPDGIVPGHNGKVWWRCSKCGYVYQAPPSRRSQGSGCRKCADKAVWSIRRANKERSNAKSGYIQMELFDETKKAT